MGANKSVELDTQRIAEIATEANGQFAKDFSATFKNCVINNVKNTYLQEKKEQKLISADTPWQVIKTGTMYKMGANVKSWKKRHFVAKNKADNYVIVYFEDEELTKEKGRICCCGYHVESFTGEEEGWYGAFGIKLTSFDEHRRQWLCKASSDSEQAEWFEVFMNACKKSQPEPIKEQVYADAFKTAFRATKAAYGYFGVCFIFGTECEMLEHLTSQILKREIVDDFILEHARKNPHSTKTAVSNVHSSIRKVVKPIVTSTWRSSFTAAESMKSSLELAVKASLRKLLDAEALIRATLQPKLAALLDPYLNDFKEIVCKPILSACFEDVITAHEQAVEGLHKEINKIINTVELTPDSIRAALLLAERVVDQTTQAGPMRCAQQTLWGMHTERLVEVQEEFDSAGMAGYDVYINVMDSLKVLLRNAVCTFGKFAFPYSDADVAAIEEMLQESATSEHARLAIAKGKDYNNAGAATVQDNSSSSSSSGKASLSVDCVPNPGATTAATGTAALAPMPPIPPVQQARGISTGGPHSSYGAWRPGTKGSVSKQYLRRTLNEVTSRLAVDAQANIHAQLLMLLSDALESRVQETIIAQCFDIVLCAQPHVTRDTQPLISLEAMGEHMVRELVRQFVADVTHEHCLEAANRLNVVSARLIGEI